MKELDDYDPQEIRNLLAQEGWLDPLPPVHRIQFLPWQRWVFWALRLYIVVMVIVVGWAFLAGHH
jgi:hypothetical protein